MRTSTLPVRRLRRHERNQWILHTERHIPDGSTEFAPACSLHSDHHVLHRPGERAGDVGVQHQRPNASGIHGGEVGFDAVLGARGSQLQLVLNTVYHLETSPGNIPYEMYATIKNNPRVKLAIPYALGDNYQGFRIVGSTEDLFNEFEYQKGKKFEFQKGGRAFDTARREAVIGSFVAQKTGLGLGDRKDFQTRIMASFADRWTRKSASWGFKTDQHPLGSSDLDPDRGIYRMTGHVLRGTGEQYTAEAGKEIPDEHKEVSAVMLKFKGPQDGMLMDQTINKQGKVATLAWPIGRVMMDLFNKIGWVTRVLTLVSYLVVLVAAASILASLYNTINERRRDFAILRSLGARRRTIFSAIILESSIIALMGSLLGFVVYAIILGVTTLVIRSQTGVVLDIFSPHPILILAPIGMTVVGAISGIFPAIKAYTTDIASNLTPIS
ncbi:MAG: ABC transporter permease [Candidatus Omnitrophica bacterium]|nr:ABC transporter permease [Candidatus Omnitrophota bacterium]